MSTIQRRLIVLCTVFACTFGFLSLVNAAESEDNIVVSAPEGASVPAEVDGADIQPAGMALDAVSNSVKEAPLSGGCVPKCAAGFDCINGKCVQNIPEGVTVGKRSTTNVKSARKTGVNEVAIDTISRREKVKNSLSLEALPWNGIVGTGLLYTFRPTPQFAIEGGGGLSSMGLKYGIRGRYCFAENKTVSGSSGLGICGVSGADGVKVSVANSTRDSVPVTYDIKPITFIQVTGGLDILTRGGIFILLNTGWAFALNDGIENVKFDGMDETSYLNSYSGDPDVVDMWNMLENLMYHGGLVLSASIGFSF